MKWEKNVWKKRPKSKALKTGSPPLTRISVIPASEECKTDHTGTVINVSFKVTFSGTFDALFVTSNASALGLPWYGDYVAGSTGLIYCSNTEAKIAPNSPYVGTTTQPGTFEYNVVFSPIMPDRLDLSPLERPAQIEFGGTDVTEIRQYDQQQNAIVNSTGDYYGNLPPFYVPGFEASLMWNVASEPTSLIKSLSWTTNNSEWNGQSTGSGAIGKVTSSETWETYQGVQVKFWRMQVPIKVRTDGNGWNYNPFDYGDRYINDDGDVVSYVDPQSGVAGPVFLDGSGGLLGGDGSTQNADPVVFPAADGDGPGGYEVLKPASWSSLPNPFAA